MEKSQMNTKVDVLISTAGVGSRMSKISSSLHKGLLPYQNEPILYNLIASIPDHLRIGLILGYKSDQIRDFIEVVFHERDFTFIYVDDWTSKYSGTSHSLKSARDFVDSEFWYFTCDGVYSNMDFLEHSYSEDVFVVSAIDSSKTDHYLTFDVYESRIQNTFFKERGLKNVFAFTGAMKIVNKSIFFRKLDDTDSVEFVSVIEKDALTYLTKNWIDLGNVESYRHETQQIVFDFSKPDEFVYQLDGKILKWWADSSIAKKKLIKPQAKPIAFPQNVSFRGQFLRYDLEPGVPFYEEIDPENFELFLDWLEDKVWTPVSINISSNVYEFYKVKTLDRVEKLGNRKFSPPYNPKYVNGVKVRSWQYHLDNINWDLLLYEHKATFVHGDLQFDNVIFHGPSKKFTLIDWRHDFAGLSTCGDIYYDFAKMLGGIYLNYQLVKSGNLDFRYTNERVEITVPSAPWDSELVNILENRALSMNLDLEKIRLLVPLIYWNMAPLHNEPFASICWCLGIKLLEERAQ